jgi:mitogen-activated protein kinase kinase kinase
VTYFERELSAPSTRRGARFGDAPVENNGFGPQSTRPGVIGVGGVEGVAGRGPATAGGLTRGKVRMTLEEKVKWIHAVFENVRIRSRKLLGFARDIRNRLDNAAEYDLGSLRSPPEPGNGENGGNSVDQASSMGSRAGGGAASNANSQTGAGMDLNGFLQTLINAGYFLVLTGSFEPEGIYLIAEPSLHDKPELIQELFCRCIRRGSAAADAESSAMAAEANLAASVLAGGDAATTVAGEEEAASDVQDAGVAGASNVETEAPRYLLLLSPRDAFMWTGRIMTLKMPRIGVDLKDRRLRLIADGPKGRLAACKAHLYSVFHAAAAASAAAHAPVEEPTSAPPTGRKGAKGAALAAAAAADALAAQVEDPAASFPLEIVNENMAHMFAVQTELRKVNKGVYMLSDTVIRAVPSIRRNLRGRHVVTSPPTEERPKHEAGVRVSKASTNCDELIQNCFGMAAEQGFRALPFIESARLQGQMTLALARLSIDWVAFICDDCVPGDRRTFKWAVAALENAMQVTRSENIFQLSEDDFGLMRTKVASCMALLISQFDILGARSSVAKAQEEQERLDREKAERDRARNLETAISNAQQQSPGLVAGAQAAANLETDRKALAAKMVHDMGGAGAPPMLNRQDSGMQATEERWVQKVMEWDAARQSIEAEQRLIGRVLDDAKPEDRGLQFLASSSSRIQIRWQQGRFIGGGTFGTVYLAVNLDSGGLMAVKEIRFQDISSTPSLYKQIKDEMTVMEMLSHPNIVEYYGIEVHRDKVYIFEEYCQGGSLAQLLEHGRIEDEAVTQVYTLQMLDGLVYLHSKGVVHRDIKPDSAW